LLASKNLKISLSVKNLSLSEFSENREEKIEKKGKEKRRGARGKAYTA